MKINITALAIFLVGIFVLTSCDKSDPMADLKKETLAIEKLSEQSNNLKNAEDAFKLYRDLNKALKGVRGVALSLDESANGDAQTMQEFEQYNLRIDKALQIITKNAEPYKNAENVKQMEKKINKILIMQ